MKEEQHRGRYEGTYRRRRWKKDTWEKSGSEVVGRGDEQRVESGEIGKTARGRRTGREATRD